jgi:hypothetical protein
MFLLVFSVNTALLSKLEQPLHLQESVNKNKNMNSQSYKTEKLGIDLLCTELASPTCRFTEAKHPRG